MKNYILFLVIVFCCSATKGYNFTVTKSFEQFQNKFEKKYISQEETNERFAIFSKNMMKVSKMNAEQMFSDGETVFGVTKFSDLTKEEFSEQYLKYTHLNTTSKNIKAIDLPVPDKIDWVAQGAVNPARNRKRTDDSLLISLVESIEGVAKISGKHPLLKLSINQVVDCCGCSPGDYAIKNGLELEETYEHGNPCGYNASKVVVKISQYVMIPFGDEKSLRSATASGPVVVGVAASSWQNYKGGILTTCDDNVNHFVQVVGYDYANNPPYWIVQNSWGTDWGEHGYLRLEAGKNLCGIAECAAYPVL